MKPSEIPIWIGGAVAILSERLHQCTKEGFTSEHDDEHTDGSMAGAAQCYAEAARRQVCGADADEVANVKYYWPWALIWLKVSDDPIRNLEKAGALIAAEIDRLQRLKERL